MTRFIQRVVNLAPVRKHLETLPAHKGHGPLIGHWVLTDSHPCADVRRFIHRLAHLAGVHRRGVTYS
jgi:hypothetical protein